MFANSLYPPTPSYALSHLRISCDTQYLVNGPYTGFSIRMDGKEKKSLYVFNTGLNFLGALSMCGLFGSLEAYLPVEWQL